MIDGYGNFDDVVRALTEREPVKVWSYLTTIFGDLAQQPGDEISGPVLSALTDRIGIKPEAMRVALHRLRKDNWIVARKDGRSSRYRLTDTGLAETVEASRRIYLAKLHKPDLWHMLISQPSAITLPQSMAELIEQADYLNLSGNAFIGIGPTPERRDDVLAIEFSQWDAPDWLEKAIMPPESSEMYRSLSEVLTSVEAALGMPQSRSVLERITLRLLTIHNWRRAVLRHSELIEMVLDEDWIGSVCRSRCAAILDRLPRPAMDELSAAVENTPY